MKKEKTIRFVLYKVKFAYLKRRLKKSKIKKK